MFHPAQVTGAFVRLFAFLTYVGLGYTLSSVQEIETGFIGQLGLAGPACNAYGTDYKNLILKVVYDSDTRLHVNIYDTNNSQFTIPDSVTSLPSDPSTSYRNSSDLAFNYESSPFAFWITRRSEPDAIPLFDTRVASLPPTPQPAVIPGVNNTELDGFPLVFEDQYLQVSLFRLASETFVESRLS